MRLIRPLGMQYATVKSKQKNRFGLYECPVCKKGFRTSTKEVKRGKSTKCKSCAMKKHGKSESRIYHTWYDMVQRTTNKNHSAYQFYGGRGILCYKKWKSFEVFYKWAMSNGYSDNLTIDRIDNDRSYSPRNCRFTTPKEQTHNTILLISSNTSGYRGVHWDAHRGKYQARLQIDGTSVFLGRYNTALQAAIARDTYIEIKKLPHMKNKIKGEDNEEI